MKGVTPGGFSHWLRSSPYAFLFLVDGLGTPAAPALVAMLEMELDEPVVIGTLSRDRVEDRSFWDLHFVQGSGPFRPGHVPPAGVYLFYQGRILFHHPGLPGGPGNALGDAPWAFVRDDLRDRIRAHYQQRDETEEKWTYRGRPSDPPPSASGAHRVPNGGRPPPGASGAHRVPPGASSGGHRLTSWGWPEPTEAPYAILEVAPDATDEEVRRAYKRRLGECHPDLLVRASARIREFAGRELQAVVTAWQTVRRLRGIR